jgi:hypothetical protein
MVGEKGNNIVYGSSHTLSTMAYDSLSTMAYDFALET